MVQAMKPGDMHDGGLVIAVDEGKALILIDDVLKDYVLYRGRWVSELITELMKTLDLALLDMP